MNECISLFSSSAAQPMNLGGKYKAHANLCNLHSGAVIFHENPNIILNRMISIDIAWTGAKFLDLRSSHHRHWGLFDKGIGEFRSELRGWERDISHYNQHRHKLTVDNIKMDPLWFLVPGLAAVHHVTALVYWSPGTWPALQPPWLPGCC